ncbi:MAG: hypothetical protein Q4G59_12515, partial [Planctomycetia bacterium]|nr:hypothetical protein [Planctomycetia bacterium]
MYKKRLFALLSIFIIVFSLSGKANADSPCVRVTGPWQIAVSVDNMSKTFNVAPVDYVSITDEKIEAIPDYDMKLARWRRAWRLEGVKARECSVSGAIVTDSVRVVGKNKVQYVAGKDFQIDDWGCVGRLDGGRIARGEAVSVSYRYAKMRL